MFVRGKHSIHLSIDKHWVNRNYIGSVHVALETCHFFDNLINFHFFSVPSWLPVRVPHQVRGQRQTQGSVEGPGEEHGQGMDRQGLRQRYVGQLPTWFSLLSLAKGSLARSLQRGRLQEKFRLQKHWWIIWRRERRRIALQKNPRRSKTGFRVSNRRQKGVDQFQTPHVRQNYSDQTKLCSAEVGQSYSNVEQAWQETWKGRQQSSDVDHTFLSSSKSRRLSHQEVNKFFIKSIEKRLPSSWYDTLCVTWFFSFVVAGNHLFPKTLKFKRTPLVLIFHFVQVAFHFSVKSCL